MDGARALVRADLRDRVVEVRVVGENRRALMAVIREHLRVIHKDITGLGVDEELETGPGQWGSVRSLEADERLDRTHSGIPSKEGTIQVETTKELNRLSGPRTRDRQNQPLKLFVCYSQKNDKQKKELLERIRALGCDEGLISFNDRDIPPCEDWDRQIRRKLDQADVVLLLVSTAMLATDYVQRVELPRACDRADRKETLIFPVILEKCHWEDRRFAKYNAVPDKGKPVLDHKPQRDGWYAVADGLKRILEQERPHMRRNPRLFQDPVQD
jgi:hypothetical protein